MHFSPTAAVTIGKLEENCYNMAAAYLIPADVVCYSVIHAYAEVGLPHQAEEVMRLMFSEFNNGSKTAEPNVRCLTSKLNKLIGNGLSTIISKF
jgi:pentatricopeptide repeat protein